MNDTIRELILRVLDYVERTPGAYFTIARWDEGVRKPDENQMHFTFYNSVDDSTSYISRDDEEDWSQLADLDEDNLRYLLSQLEGEEQ